MLLDRDTARDHKLEETTAVLIKVSRQVDALIMQNNRAGLRQLRLDMIQIADLSRTGLREADNRVRDRHIDQMSRILVKLLDIISKIDYALI